MIIIDTAKMWAMRAYELWNWIFFDLMRNNLPDYLVFDFGHRWYHNAAVGLLWLAVYATLAFLYFKVIGAPVWIAMRHMHSHGCKMLPWWHIVIYAFLLIYLAQSAGSPGGRIDITAPAGILLAWVYFLVKAGWRVLYFPLLQAMLLLFLFGAFCLFIPALLVIAAMMIFGVGLAGLASGDSYTCSGCGRRYSTTGRCRYCNTQVS
jgi:hypothetical protein